MWAGTTQELRTMRGGRPTQGKKPVTSENTKDTKDTKDADAGD